MKLEDKVLSYINLHPEGLRIKEMEQPLGETRLRIGYVAKVLLEEGKVQVFDNLYFPKLRQNQKTQKLNLPQAPNLDQV